MNLGGDERYKSYRLVDCLDCPGGHVAQWTIDPSPVNRICEMNYYVKLVVTIFIVIALAEFFPEWVNAFLILVLLSMFVISGEQYARLIAALRL